MTEVSFDRAEPVLAAAGAVPAQSASLSCRSCKATLMTYYSINGIPLCDSCSALVRAHHSNFSVAVFARAALFGLGGMLASALLCYGVRAATGYNIGLVSIAAGFIVGWLVRKGFGRGSAATQALAMLLTYVGVCMSYVPYAMQKFIQRPDATPTSIALMGLASTAVLTVKLPGILISVGPISLALMGFAVYEAWKLNKAGPFIVEGPLEVRAPVEAAANAEAASLPAPSDG